MVRCGDTDPTVHSGADEGATTWTTTATAEVRRTVARETDGVGHRSTLATDPEPTANLPTTACATIEVVDAHESRGARVVFSGGTPRPRSPGFAAGRCLTSARP